MAPDPPIEDLLGPLGGAVLRIVIERREASVGTVVADLAANGRRPAYTTVMTILSRLHERGLLERRLAGRRYLYRPAADEGRMLEELSERAIDQLLQRYGTAALRQFAVRLRELDPELRARLIELASGRR